CMQTLEFPWTF
nr:immunoglobulin light chain junction region [Macaca mulatta]MOV83308.1 immunoglobulin light chain junction region [Macaca mulatta]MOW41317.1 immunoglobulin light chain junction region [Macaca mulatta]MOW43575.1 immunoglobulin light chain junction region [Macaca mulatta]MOW43797.1 immunoglobulin light chain junction region [Macaca mulatta]